MAYYKGQPIFGPRGPAGPDGNPIGTIINFMGISAPNDYLVCDGAQYSISQYPDLAQFFQQQFGQKNHFGGDGVATFAVPDMRNLFLRGYHGEAGERLSGEVGERQDGTVFPDSGATETSNATGAIYVGNSNPSLGSYPENADTFNGLGTTKTSAIVATAYGLPDGHKVAQSYTARPVNMAVLYCIKAVESSSGGNAVGEVYSTEEIRIGTWIDGKPLYRKTIVFENASIPADWGNANPRIVKIPDIDMETLVDCTSRFYPGGTDNKFCTTASVVDGYLAFFNNYSTGAFTCSGTFTLEYTKTTDQGIIE